MWGQGYFSPACVKPSYTADKIYRPHNYETTKSTTQACKLMNVILVYRCTAKIWVNLTFILTVLVSVVKRNKLISANCSGINYKAYYK